VTLIGAISVSEFFLGDHPEALNLFGVSLFLPFYAMCFAAYASSMEDSSSRTQHLKTLDLLVNKL